jgi:hypothetical protein
MSWSITLSLQMSGFVPDLRDCIIRFYNPSSETIDKYALLFMMAFTFIQCFFVSFKRYKYYEKRQQNKNAIVKQLQVMEPKY